MLAFAIAVVLAIGAWLVFEAIRAPLEEVSEETVEDLSEEDGAVDAFDGLEDDRTSFTCWVCGQHRSIELLAEGATKRCVTCRVENL